MFILEVEYSQNIKINIMEFKNFIPFLCDEFRKKTKKIKEMFSMEQPSEN